MRLPCRFQTCRGIARCARGVTNTGARVAPRLYALYASDGDYLPANKNLRPKKHQAHLLGPEFSRMWVKQAPVCCNIQPELCRGGSFIPHVCEHVCARALSAVHYVSSDLQRGTEGIFSPRRLGLSVKCLSSLIISIRVTGDRAFCSERTYCKNCQMGFVSRSNISIYSGS